MRRLILVRHATHAEVGHVLSGRSEIALNPRGMAEAAMLRDALDGTAIASLHCSPRRRACETAAPLESLSGLKMRNAPALDEIDFGDFTGRSFATLDQEPDWHRWNAARGVTRCPNGETMGEAVTRAFAYVTTLPPDQYPAVCVTHCDIIRGIVAHALGLSLDRIFAFDCEPASWTTLGVSASNLRIIALNERAIASFD